MHSALAPGVHSSSSGAHAHVHTPTRRRLGEIAGFSHTHPTRTSSFTSYADNETHSFAYGSGARSASSPAKAASSSSSSAASAAAATRLKSLRVLGITERDVMLEKALTCTKATLTSSGTALLLPLSASSSPPTTTASPLSPPLIPAATPMLALQRSSSQPPITFLAAAAAAAGSSPAATSATPALASPSQKHKRLPLSSPGGASLPAAAAPAPANNTFSPVARVRSFPMLASLDSGGGGSTHSPVLVSPSSGGGATTANFNKHVRREQAARQRHFNYSDTT